MKTWAIGDIHGCYRELMALYKQLLDAGLQPEKEVVVFMGDYMDRGPDSKKVVQQLMKWQKQYFHWIFLYGNHEDILRNWIRGEQKYQENAQWSCFLANGGKETLKSFDISEPIRSLFPKKYLEFLFHRTRVMYETENYVFVHGAMLPDTPISQHIPKQEIIDAMLWGRETFIDSDYDWGKKVIFGHSAAFERRWGEFGYPIVMKNKIGIDGAVCPPGNKNLIAVELPAEKFYLQESFALYDRLANI
jgi:serine/threonine protein phosphatase 1